MGKTPKMKIEHRVYRGVRFGQVGPRDERGLFDLRPMRFQVLNGASAVDILTELVNLPSEPRSSEDRGFITRVHNLELGGTSSGGGSAPPMTCQEVVRLRELYRQFWEVRGWKGSGPYMSMLFLRLIGPWPEAWKSPVPDKLLRPEQEHKGDLFPILDYKDSALQMDWKTGRFRIIARGPVDWLTHAVFQNRNRLRVCSGCKRLFVAFPSKESLCSAVCKQESGRGRKRKWWRENRGKQIG